MYGIHALLKPTSFIDITPKEKDLKQLCLLIQSICNLHLNSREEGEETDSDRFRGLLKKLNTEQIFTLFSYEEIYEYPIENLPFYIIKEEQILKNEASDSVKHKGENALYCAAKFGCVPILKTLIKLGSCPNYGKPGENKALHAAVHHGHEDAVRILLKYGANINERAFGGCTALDIAYSNKRSAIADLLLQKGGRINT